MDNLRAAFGLGQVVEGEAFDRDLQERKKAERLAAKEAERRKQEKEVEQVRDAVVVVSARRFPLLHAHILYRRSLTYHSGLNVTSLSTPTGRVPTSGSSSRR